MNAAFSGVETVWDNPCGRVAVVTGAAGGIGLAIVERLATAGMSVVVCDLDNGAIDTVVNSVHRVGGSALGLSVDVADPDAVEDMARAVYDEFGAVHLLCNNAGILLPDRFRPVWEFPLDEWKTSIDVNLMGVVHGLRSFVPRMIEGGAPGHIVNTASIGGLVSGAWSAPYSVAKHGLVRLTEALYAGLSEQNANIGVTALLPGLVRSKMAPSAVMSPESVADMLVDAVENRTLYVLTSNSYDDAIRYRTDCILNRQNPTFDDIRSLNKTESTYPAE
ncbi:SDR family NAD(P)-dependent oxidoreductase [Rhodococcus sp. NPDC055024]